MKNIFLYIFLSFFLLVSYESSAQIISEAAARAEIRKRGLDEDEVLLELSKKGIDLNNIDLNNPVELSRAETALREVIAELEKKKTTGATTSPTEIPIQEVTQEKAKEVIESNQVTTPEQAKEVTKGSEEIVEAIEEGATLEEAVAETLQESQDEKLPDATTYGQHIFRDKSLSVFRQSDNARPPNSYVLGAGDKLAINIWGISEESAAFEINSEGYIKPSLLPRVYLAGLTIAQARDRLKSFYNRSYRFRDEDFDVTLATARTISVNIVGEVENSGSFTISALNTAFNALVAAGGPSSIGSVRNVQLISGTEVKEVDVYEFLLNPASAQNFYLKDGDFIFVPVASKLVSIAGQIKRPFRYELKDDEGLNQLIEYAGGLTDRAIRKTMRVVRVENDEEILVDIPYAELITSGTNFDLRSGDAISIATLPQSYENVIRLTGAFLIPGEYAHQEGMRISDLIGKTEFLTGAILDSAYLKRINEDNITVQYQIINLSDIIDDPLSSNNLLLNPRDEIIVRSINQFGESTNISISGAIRIPGEYPVDKSGSLKISDLVFISGGLKEDADSIAYLIRSDPSNPLKKDYVRVNINNALANVNGSDNITLRGMDRLTVYSKSRYLDELSISISGSVRIPGTYPVDKSGSVKISDIIHLSGGLEEDADDIGFLFRRNPANPLQREYVRVNIRNALDNVTGQDNITLRGMDELIIYSKTRYMDQFSVSVSGAVREPSEVAFDPSLTLNDLITLAGGLKLEASPSRVEVFRVKIEKDKETEILAATLQLDDNGELLNSDFQLQPYDKIYVRTTPEFELQRMITINGEVKYPGQYAILDDNETISSLIQRAGGVTNEAFLGGGTLFRNENDLGYVVFDFENALNNFSSPDNIIVQSGDNIVIPKQQKLVTIFGATKAIELHPEDVVNTGRFNVPFESGKSAKYYIDEFAGGIADNGHAGRVSVTYPNGEVKKSGRFLLWRTYPEVKEGSIIKVGYKDVEPPKVEGDRGDDGDVKWGEVLADSVAQATAILSLVLLLQRID